MGNKRPDYIREILERDRRENSIEETRMIKGYAIAAAIGVALLFAPLAARGCYPRVKEFYNSHRTEQTSR